MPTVLNRKRNKDRYSETYYQLVDTLTKERVLDVLTAVVIPNYIILMGAISLVLARSINEISDIIAGIQIILGVPAFLLLIYFLLYVLRISIKRPIDAIPHLAAFVLVGLQPPLSAKSGYSYEDVQRLKRIAEIEQGAADWRGNFVNIVIIGLATFAIGGLIESVNWFAEFERFNLVTIFNLPDNLTIGVLLAWVIVAILATWFFYYVFSYLREYLGTELANRTILLMCEEVAAILEEKGASQKVDFKFHEKRDFVESLGCQLVRKDRVPNNYFSIFPVIEDDNGNGWLIVSETKSRKSRS